MSGENILALSLTVKIEHESQLLRMSHDYDHTSIQFQDAFDVIVVGSRALWFVKQPLAAAG